MIVPGSRGTGLVPQPVDRRDFQYAALIRKLGSFLPPASYSLEKYVEAIDDQGPANTCAVHALGGVLNVLLAIAHKPRPRLAINFTYYYGRKRDGSTGDVGCTLRSIAKSFANEGRCPEYTHEGTKDARIVWPDGKATIDIDPHQWWTQNYRPGQQLPIPLVTPVGTYDIWQDPSYIAHHHQEGSYYAMAQSVAAYKLAISQNRPVAFGVEAKASLYGVGNSGIWPVPNPNEQSYGYHALYAVGYDDMMVDGPYTGFLRVIGSWGDGYADKGKLWIPYALFTPAPGVVNPFDAWTFASGR